MDILERIMNLVKSPFKTDGDFLDFVLLMGLIVLVTYAWSRVLKQIVE